MAKFWSLIAVLRALIALWSKLQSIAEMADRIERDRKAKEREKAAEDVKNAESEEDIWDSQERVVRNKP